MAIRYNFGIPTPRRNPLLSFVREHVPLVGSGVAAIIFAIRCVAVTNGDTHVASILLAQTSLGDAIRALLFFVLPVMLLFLSGGLAIAAAMSIPTPKSFSQHPWRYLTGWSGRKPIGLLAASWTASIVSSYLRGELTTHQPLWSTVYMLLGIVLWLFITLGLFWFALMWHWYRRLSLSTRFTVVSPYIVALLAALFIGLAIGQLFDTDNFWLPRERLVFEDDFANKKPPVIGYVLNTSGDHFVILHDDPRIIIEKQGPLRERAFCYPKVGYKEHFKEVGQDMPSCP